MSRPRSIRTRLVCSLLCLIGVTFVLIFVAFNVVVQRYIDTSARQELDDAARMLMEPRGAKPDEPALSGPGGPRQRDWEDAVDSRPPNAIGAQVRAFIWDGQLPADLPEHERSVAANIAAGMRLDDALEEVQTVRAGDETYLVTALEGSSGVYFVLYVDITQLETLVRNINGVLVLILVAVGAVAVLVALRLASSMARPIEEISDFARQIGNNVFTPSTLSFRDREPAELLRVMNSTAAKLAEYDSEQKTFFQNVSHELKTPLMTIRCNAEGIVYEVMDPRSSGRTIMAETDRLVGMIDDLLFISRLDTITRTDVASERDLREILSNCAEAQRSLALAKGVSIECDFDDEPVLLDVSEKNISRAFSNLLSNAVRYAATSVALSCRSEDGQAVVRVWNDGPAISQKDLPHVFERFYKGPGGQSGIGLAIVRSIAEKLGGSVSVVSDDEGTCFAMDLPQRLRESGEPGA